MNILSMTRINYRPLTLTAAAALALSSPTLILAAPPAIAAEQASDTSCDADSLHAFSRGHQDLALVGDSGDLSFIARDDESGKDYASGEFYVEVGSNAAFDESAGSDIPSIGWQIPQTQDPNIPLGGVQHQLPRRGHCCRCHFILDATQRPGRRTHGGLSELRGC